MPDGFYTTATDASVWAAEFMRIWGGRLPIDLDEGTMLGWFANAIEAGRSAGLAAPKRVGVLSHDNGEYDAYVAYFDDPDRLEEAVKVLNEQRMDTEAMEMVAAEVRVEPLIRVPASIDDEFLDQLALLLEDAGVYVETAKEAAERRAEEEAENEEQPFVPSPGQLGLLL